MDYVSFTLEQQEGCFRGDRYEAELETMLKDFAELLHAREWYLSGDICEGCWNEGRDAFVAKYLSLQPQNYCQDCRNWHYVGDNYGRCDFGKGYLIHRCETICERFSGRGKE